MYSYGPNLGCVLKLGYRRPLDDSDYLGDITWEVNSNDEEVIAAFEAKNSRDSKNLKKNNLTFKSKENRNAPEGYPSNPVIKRRTKRLGLSMMYIYYCNSSFFQCSVSNNISSNVEERK